MNTSPTYNLSITAEEAMLLQNLLVERPIKEAGPLHAKFLQQMMAEQQRIQKEQIDEAIRTRPVRTGSTEVEDRIVAEKKAADVKPVK